MDLQEKSKYLKKIKSLGTGTFGETLLVESEGQLYALKILKKVDLIKFKSEVNILKTLSTVCGGYVAKYENSGLIHWDGKEVAALLMEFIDGVSLFDFSKNNEVDENQYKIIAKNLFNAIDCLHQNDYIHQDIKLENIMLKSDLSVVLIDFGLSCTNFCKATDGTPAYMSPEKISSNILKTSFTFEQAKASDVWAAGISLFALVNKEYPFYEKAKQESKNNTLSKNFFIQKFAQPKKVIAYYLYYIKNSTTDNLAQLTQKEIGKKITLEALNPNWKKRKNAKEMATLID